MHIVGREAIAKEILQEVFIRLWTKAPRFETEEQLYGWIFRACHNSGVDYLRSAAFRRETVYVVADEEGRVGSKDIARDYSDAETVRKVLQQFSERDAQIVAYVAMDEMTHEETAQMLGISKKTVTRTILRARETLQNWRWNDE